MLLAGACGHVTTLIDGELYRPQSCTDPERCRAAGIPQDGSSPPSRAQAQAMIAQAGRGGRAVRMVQRR